MPTLPLTLPAPLVVDLAVHDRNDVLALFPQKYLNSDTHPVLDALAEGLAGMLIEYQKRAEYAAAQADVLRATEGYLDGLAGDRGVQRGAGELDTSYRDRVTMCPGEVTPTAIRAAVNAILAEVTDAEAQVYESVLDRWYVSDGTASWYSFVGDGLSNICPQYPDRLYEDDADINGGLSRPQSSPGGAIVFADGEGRMFVIRVPQLNDVDAPRQFATDGSPTGGDPGFFATDGTPAVGFAFVSNDYMTAAEAYQAIVNTVQRIKGHGIRWVLLADRKL